MPITMTKTITVPTYGEIREGIFNRYTNAGELVPSNTFGIKFLAGSMQVVYRDVPTEDWLTRREKLLAARAMFSVAREIEQHPTYNGKKDDVPG